MKTKLIPVIFLAVLFSAWAFISLGQPASPKKSGEKPAVKPDKSTTSKDKKEKSKEPRITSKIRKAINKALRYMSTRQNSDGSYGSSVRIATTGLAGLAFLAGGHFPTRGQYSSNVRKIVAYLLKTQGKSGFYYSPNDNSRIHGHGYAALFMSEVLGMLGDEDLQKEVKSSIEKAVRISIGSQTVDGGWGYVPDANTWDEGSTTITQIQALRAARDAGIKINRRVIDRAIEYVHKCAMPTPYTDENGKTKTGYTFKYSLRYNSSRSTFPLTAAAASVLQGSGAYEDETLDGAIGWLKNYYLSGGTKYSNRSWGYGFYFYSHFYAMQVMWHSSNRNDWIRYYAKISNELVKRQRSNGAWNSRYGDIYGTAIATMILAIPDRYLPIFLK